jgi:hypothetical protein
MESQNTPEPLTCGCGRTLAVLEAVTFDLTEEERQAYVQKGMTPPKKACYCKPCSRVFQHPEHGPRLLQGRFVRMALAQGLGVRQASKAGDLYYEKLKSLIGQVTP